MKYDIAIAGMGPVGAMAALLFAESGLDVVVIERSEEVYPLPRAVNLDGEIIRAFQQVGRGEAVNALMQEIRPGDRAGFANAKRQWLFGQEYSAFGSNGWQAANMFDQPEFEAYLGREVAALRGVTLYRGHELVRIGEAEDGVELEVRNCRTGNGFPLRAARLLGCDGASSLVRKSLGIGWRDLGYDHDWLVVDVIIKDTATLGRDTIQVCDPERIVTYVCTRDPYRRWEFRLNPGETREEMLDPEKIHSLIASWTPRDTYEIRRAAVYQFHAAVADDWCVGNIFLAGDAAHQTPPFLGQGLNAGMRDVINLSWKFPMVLRGIADDRLLDTYYRERSAHAHDLVDWAVAIGKLMDHLADTERARKTGMPPPEAPPALKSAGYGQGREAPPLRDGVLCVDQVSDTGSTGYLFRQPLVRDAAGREFRLDDLLGSGFAVVSRHADALEISDTSRQVLDLIDASLVSLDALVAVRGHFDPVLDHSKAVIIRPDRIVFGHTTDELGLDELISLLSEKLALRI